MLCTGLPASNERTTVNTRIYPAEKLAKVKAKADTPTYAPAIKTLMKEADKAMNLTPPSVMDKV